DEADRRSAAILAEGYRRDGGCGAPPAAWGIGDDGGQLRAPGQRADDDRPQRSAAALRGCDAREDSATGRARRRWNDPDGYVLAGLRPLGTHARRQGYGRVGIEGEPGGCLLSGEGDPGWQSGTGGHSSAAGLAPALGQPATQRTGHCGRSAVDDRTVWGR